MRSALQTDGQLGRRTGKGDEVKAQKRRKVGRQTGNGRCRISGKQTVSWAAKRKREMRSALKRDGKLDGTQTSIKTLSALKGSSDAPLNVGQMFT